MSERLSYNKICNVEDFRHPALIPVIRDVFRFELSRLGPAFPLGREYRKYWEVGMAIRAMADCGALHRRAEVLGVAAGNEPTVFWLTRHVRRVFARISVSPTVVGASQPALQCSSSPVVIGQTSGMLEGWSFSI